jgi:flagellar basal body L-ring protein FlgH
MLVILASCADLPKTERMDVAVTDLGRPIPLITPAAARATGGLFQKTSYHPAFEDAHARAVGDCSTIQIVEKVTASQVNQPTAVGAKWANDFSGKGGIKSANMAPNGHNAQAEAQTVDGLTRFFFSFLPF